MKKKNLLLMFLLLVSLSVSGVVKAQTNTVTPGAATTGELTTFTFDNSFLNVSAANYTWTFGDNSSSTVTSLPTINHTYSVNGSYSVIVNVVAIPNVGPDWNISGDWQQELGSYTTTILVIDSTPASTDDGILGVAVSALLLAFVFPIVFFVISKRKKE